MSPIRPISPLLATAFLALAISARAQIITPPLAKLVEDFDGKKIPIRLLPSRINQAFDQNLEGNWFARVPDNNVSTGPTDTIHLLRRLKKEAIDSSSLTAAELYRSAWRTACKRVFLLKVPLGDSKSGEGPQFKDTEKEISLIQIVTIALESTVDLWLVLDLGPAEELDKWIVSMNLARDLRATCATAHDRQKVGEIPDSYDEILRISSKMLDLMAPAK